MKKQLLKILKYIILSYTVLFNLLIFCSSLGIIKLPIFKYFNYTIILSIIGHGPGGDLEGAPLFIGVIFLVLFLINFIFLFFYFLVKMQIDTKKILFIFITIITLLQLLLIL